MKLKGAKAIHYDSGPNMTPLVDVVMVILIFLMLTGSFGAVARFLPSSMPIKVEGKGNLDKDKIPKIPDPQLEVFVNTNSDHSVYTARLTDGVQYVNGVAQSGKTLVQALTEKRVAHQAGGKSADTLQVVICPKKDTSFEQIMLVYQAAMAAECPKIGFQTARD
jgi:biopolymer transport protein ExbD